MRRGPAKLKADLTKYVSNALLNRQHWGLSLFPKVERSKVLGLLQARSPKVLVLDLGVAKSSFEGVLSFYGLEGLRPSHMFTSNKNLKLLRE